MKHFTFILSLYIIILTAIPCIDVPQGNTLQKVELSQGSGDNHKDNTGHCSPFCTCSCCASPLIYQVFTVHFNSFSDVQKHLSAYTYDCVSPPSSSIWQPPKIS